MENYVCTEIIARADTSVLVLLEEEYGYRDWFWFPNMEANELGNWWQSLKSIESYGMSPESLPGDLYQIKDEESYITYGDLQSSHNHYSAHIWMDDDSVLIRPDKSEIYHRGYKGRDRLDA